MSKKLLRHVVLFGFKATTTPEQVTQIEQVFATLPDQIDVIHEFEWGTDVSVEGLSQGYTHCFLVTFRTAADRDAYLPHPAHQAFGKLVTLTWKKCASSIIGAKPDAKAA
jgi:hypothetical protein